MKTPSNGAKVVDRARQLYSSSRKMATEEFDTANSFIHDNPVKSVLLGVGVGYLVSWLFRSRD